MNDTTIIVPSIDLLDGWCGISKPDVFDAYMLSFKIVGAILPYFWSELWSFKDQFLKDFFLSEGWVWKANFELMKVDKT